MPRRAGRLAPLIALLLALLPAASCGSESGREAGIAPEELAARVEAGQAPLVLDVRSREEFASGHVPGALNIPYDELPARTAELGRPSPSE